MDFQRVISGKLLAALAACGGLFVQLSPADAAPPRPLTLSYDRPAAVWTEALPIGNGRLGAMVFGGRREPEDAKEFALDETLQFNEDTFWAGGPYNPNRDGAWRSLAEARRLIFADKLIEAHLLIDKTMMGAPRSQMPYQPVGDLRLAFPTLVGKPINGYRRELDLDRAVATVEYEIGGVRYRREVFSSPVDQVLVVRVTADRAASINFDVSFGTPHEKEEVAALGADGLSLLVHAPKSKGIAGVLRCYNQLKAIADGGQTKAADGRLVIRGANSATLLLASGTNFVNYQDTSGDPRPVVAKQIDRAAAKSYDSLLADHAAGHQYLFRRVSLDLGVTPAIEKTTDRRIKEFANGDDPQLVELLFQYGRYLLISSSRPGTRPANLQGIWNHRLRPPWDSKMTVNINFEMNYWPAESTNLSECHDPLLEMLPDLAESGRRTANAHYNARGWVCHHNTDQWLATAPIDGPAWGMWPTGGAWLCQHLWYRYEYLGDEAFLRTAYPIMKGAAEFFLDTLVEDPNTGCLVTCPSISPENRRLRDKRVPPGVSVCAGPTMDSQILQDLFSHCRQAAEILEIDEGFREQLAAAERRLPPMKIGAASQLQEWQDDYDLQVPEPQHRHVSHLYGLYPSDQVTARSTPELFAAARKSLEMRGDGGAGWAMGWKINFWARLQDGDRAYKLIRNLMQRGTYPNLFDSHPPFQIDGNFGATSGIVEMLMQSFAEYEDRQLTGVVELLPALPSKWPTGSVTGLRARGGVGVDLSWREGRLNEASLHSERAGPVVVRYGDDELKLDLLAGERKVLTAADF